jgi:hypothetical protein
MSPKFQKQQPCFVPKTAEKGNNISLKRIAITLLILTSFSAQLRAQDVVDATTMNNKVMAGYQGWFRTPGDQPGSTSWAHVFNTNRNNSDPSPENLAFDTWPDMSELTSGEKYPTPGFTYPDGSQAYMYSAQNYKTVLRHFQWMKQYGVDGVWLSEFCSRSWERPGPSANLNIMENVKKAATATGRTWAFMWDMSGFHAGTSKSDIYNIIISQWKRMVDEGVATDPRYMHHNGKPVLLIWGFFPNRPASQPEYMKAVIDTLQAPGKYQATLVAGVDPNWRAEGTPEFQAMLMSMSALQPWSVGRAIKDPATGYKIQNTTLWAGDIEKCKANNVIFMPVFNSGTHKAGPPPPASVGPIIPRRTGNYLWEQFVAASKYKEISSAFVAMFDEINEGTQIMKITNHPPTQAPFLTYDGATGDYYLRLVGEGAKMMKNHAHITKTIPISPFDPNKWYEIKNRNSGFALRTATGASIVQGADADADAGTEWQFIYDGKGYFIIKSKSSGKALTNGGSNADNSPIAQAADEKSDNAKWRLEWDGTGACRIINKVSGKSISNNGSTTMNAPVVQIPDTNSSNDMRWQIIEE